MKAVIYTKYGSPEVLSLGEVPKPVPNDDEVLIKIHATLVTAADGMMRRGIPKFGRLILGLTGPKKQIPGTEFAGTIESVGKDVTLFKPGDEIVGSSDISFGAYAEYIALPQNTVIARKPSHMTFGESVAACEGSMTALPFLRDQGKIEAGQKVLINGASGAVGSAAVQLAKYFDTHVTGVCGSANVEMVQSLGADCVIDYTKQDFTFADQKYDIVFDTVGKSSFGRCKRILSRNGRYLSTVLGFTILFQMFRTSLIGNKKARFQATGLRKPEEKKKDLAFLIGLFEFGRIKPHIDKQYPLERIVEAHRYVDTGHKRGNVVIKIA